MLLNLLHNSVKHNTAKPLRLKAMPQKNFNKFLQVESVSGLVLLGAALLSFVIANTTSANWVSAVHPQLHFFVNEGLMSIFFFGIGLELRTAYQQGFLQRASIILPGITALFGMLLPALVYLAFNHQELALARGWAIPVATDIAFAVGILSLFGKRVPHSLKLFLLSLAIYDDIGAILIIAFVYSTGISLLAFTLIIAVIFTIAVLRYFVISQAVLYLICGLLLWLACYHAHIHPTIAGFLLALLLPNTLQNKAINLQQIERSLHPVIAFGIMPLFALVNAGIPLAAFKQTLFADTVVLGIVCGLFFGKAVGVMLSAYALIKTNATCLPKGCNWLSFSGVAVLCGVGFTMSLFLGTLSFPNDSALFVKVQLGVIIGSLFSGIVGAGILYIAFAKKS